MSTAKDISVNQKNHLTSLLRIKKTDMSKSPEAMEALHIELIGAVAVMDKEDVEWVENVVGIKAL